MAKLTTAEFIDAIKELSVLELNDLVKACEEEFGVSAAAGVVVAAAAGDAAGSTVYELRRDRGQDEGYFGAQPGAAGRNRRMHMICMTKDRKTVDKTCSL